MRLPGGERRALDRIGRRLAAEDPRLGLRFAFFTKLTRHDAMPATEQVPRRLQRFARSAVILPLIVISLITLAAAAWISVSMARTASRFPWVRAVSLAVVRLRM